MKKLILLAFPLLISCCNSEEFKVIEDKSVITDMKVVYNDNRVEIRTYKLDGHDRILVRTAHGVDDDHSEACKKCYEDEDPCN
jgi:hypothetical protein